MLRILQTETFRRWRSRLKDQTVRGLIAARLDRLAFGHLGDAKPVGDGIGELRIHHGPGYRLYFRRRGDAIVILLCGGTKRTQSADIAAAKRIAAELENEEWPTD